MARFHKLSIALLLYTTILWISQMTLNVTANEMAGVQETVPGTSGSHLRSTTDDLDRPDDHIQNSMGYYQKYKQFVAKHNKAFTIFFGVLFVISWVGGIYYCCQKNSDGKQYLILLVIFGIVIVGIVICKLCSQNGFTFFRSKKAPVMDNTVDSTG